MLPVRLHKTASSLTRADYFILATILPFMALAFYDFNSFILGWNQGRGGLSFALFFLALEWYDARKIVRVTGSKIRFAIWAVSLGALSFFYIGVYAFGFHKLISNYAAAVKIDQGVINWPWMWEYLMVGVYLFIVTVSLFGFRSVRSISVPWVYAFGMGLILSLDSLFPYDTLGLLHGWVGVIWDLVLGLLQLSGVTVLANPSMLAPRPWVFRYQNRLFISGNTGAMTLAIYWPSSGIVSMLIYSMVIITLLIKIDAPSRRKLAYAVIGAVGTFFVNVIRVFLISYYVAYISIDVNAFHEVIGEILFLPWVGIFLLAVLRAEGYIGKTSISSEMKLPAGTQPR